METLSSLVIAIQDIIQDEGKFSEPVIVKRINQKVIEIAGGIRMPLPGGNYFMSPPLPDLYKYDTVNTSTTAAYVSLPSDYQRKVFKITDSTGNRYSPPQGGDYYAHMLFMGQINNLTLSESGSIYRVAIKGSKLYYQGIPTTAESIGIHYYRRPVDMALDGDNPDGIPEHLQLRLIKHGVLADIFGEAIEDGQDNSGIATRFHNEKFTIAMSELCDHVGIDAEPQYYGGDIGEDGGACDG